MNAYLVNVDIGTTIQVQVSASSEDEAEQLAIEKAEQIISNSPKEILNSLVALDAQSTVFLQDLNTLDKKLIIKGD